MKRTTATRLDRLKSNKIPKAVIGVLDGLCEIGYMSSREKRDMVYRVDAGDMTVYAEVRELLLKMADDLKKINR